jgi:hypothetical protein
MSFQQKLVRDLPLPSFDMSASRLGSPSETAWLRRVTKKCARVTEAAAQQELRPTELRTVGATVPARGFSPPMTKFSPLKCQVDRRRHAASFCEQALTGLILDLGKRY